MIPLSSSRRTGADRCPPAGFTLIELVVALTIVAIIVGFSIPVMKGIDREKIAREPVADLVGLVREVRYRAISEDRPYQIAFENGRFVATRFSVAVSDQEGLTTYLNDLKEEAKRLREQIRIKELKRAVIEKEGVKVGDPVPSEPDLLASLPYSRVEAWPEDVSVNVLFWGDEAWEPVVNQSYRRWV
ncbi:MAG: prepilin-type N-terminal cleavage/methylation domain-containing protein, partial [Verrucomicrobiota bacterium]